MSKSKKKKAEVIQSDPASKTLNTIDEAILLAKEFIKRAYAYKERLYQEPNSLVYIGCKESGAVKRVSMDLTRILAKVRNPNKQ